MPRTVKEWIGKTDDTAIPTRVKLRVFEAANECCKNCGIRFSARVQPEYDHITALVNGGENRETNLQCLCRACHKPKTAADVATKSRDRSVRAKHLGIKTKARSSFSTNRDGKWKRKVDGTLVPRN